jgi:hypothetical protein
MRSCWTLSTSVSVHRRLTIWSPSWRYRVCFHLIELVSIGDKYIVFKAVIHATMMHWIDGLECINRCWTEWGGYFKFKMAFVPYIDIRVRPSEGTFFKRYVNYQNLSALFSEGFQRGIFMRIRFLIFFLFSTIRKTRPCAYDSDNLRKLVPDLFSTTAQDAIIYWFDTGPIGAVILYMSFRTQSRSGKMYHFNFWKGLNDFTVSLSLKYYQYFYS